MSLKAVVFLLGCSIAWFVFLPLLVVGGGIALFVYAVGAEVGDFVLGGDRQSLDSSSAREIAHRMVLGLKSNKRRTPTGFVR